MATLCQSLISQDIESNCDNPLVRGMESDGIIINRQDIDFASTVFDNTNANIIKTLVLKTGKKGYAVQQDGSTPFTGTNIALATGTYRNTFTNQVALVVLNNDPDVAEKVIDGLANGEFVTILKNKAKGTGGKGEYQVFGYYQGLRASEITSDKYSEDTDGGWAVTLEETGSPKSAVYFFNTDSATTATQYESLKSA